jgi:FkbM family methyltransferase
VDVAELIEAGRYDEVVRLLEPRSAAGSSVASNNLAIVRRRQNDEAGELYYALRAYEQNTYSITAINTLMRALRGQGRRHAFADLYESRKTVRALDRLHHLWGAEALIAINRTDAAQEALARCAGFPRADENSDQFIALSLAAALSDHDGVFAALDRMEALGAKLDGDRVSRLFAAGKMAEAIALFDAKQSANASVRERYKGVILAALSIADRDAVARLLDLKLPLNDDIRRVAAAFLANQAEVEVFSGANRYRFPFSATNLSIAIDHTNGRFYEGPFLKKLAALTKPDGLVVDIGANIGNHSLYLAGEAGCRVLPIECNPRMVPLLRQAVAWSGLEDRIDLSRLGHAAADRVGTIFFNHIRDDYSNILAADAQAGLEIPSLSIDSLDLRDCCLIKIDVDGGERVVLEGMEATIDRLKPPVAIEVLNGNISWVRQWFDRRGYAVLNEDASSEIYSEFIMVHEDSAFRSF